jgi:hypothetical protein
MKDEYKNIGTPNVCLIEECSELIKILCKVERFGWDNWHPKDKNKIPNSVLVWEEMDDVEFRMKQVKDFLYKNGYEINRKKETP